MPASLWTIDTSHCSSHCRFLMIITSFRLWGPLAKMGNTLGLDLELSKSSCAAVPLSKALVLCWDVSLGGAFNKFFDLPVRKAATGLVGMSPFALYPQYILFAAFSELTLLCRRGMWLCLSLGGFFCPSDLWLIHKSLRKQAKHKVLLSLIYAWLWIEERYVSDLMHLIDFHFLHPLNSEEFNGMEGVHNSICYQKGGFSASSPVGQQGQAAENDFRSSFVICGSPSALRTGGRTRGIRQAAHTALQVAAPAPRSAEQPCWHFASILWAENPSGEPCWGLSYPAVSSSLGHLFWKKSLDGGVAHKS